MCGKQSSRSIMTTYACFALLVMMQRRSSAYIIAPITRISVTTHHHHSRLHGKHLVYSPSIQRRCRSTRDCRLWTQSNDNESATDVVDEGRHDNKNYKWSAQTIAIALPALAGMMTDPILSMVDTLFVGQLGATTSTITSTTKTATTSSIPLAALGACTSIFHLAFHCVKGTTATTASLVAGAVVRDNQTKQQQRDDDDDETKKEMRQKKETTLIAETSMQQAFLTGTIISLFLLLFGTNCLNAMGIPTSSTQLFSSAFTYLNYRAVAAPAVVLLTASEGIFRGFGDVITPWKVSLVVAGLNLILDPFCMFRKQSGMGMMGLGMGVKGAAVATSFSQLCGALLYGNLLLRKQGVLKSNDNGDSTPKMVWKKLKQIVSRNSDDSDPELKQKKRAISMTILRANAAMILKQGSLLLGWAYATSRATRMGHVIVAAHQMGLSIWMLFSYALDGISVAAQVLMAREYEELRIVENDVEKAAGQQKKVRSLSIYMMAASLIQGLIASAAILILYKLQPSFILTNDPAVKTNLLQLFPHLSAQMALVSATLVAEALTVGGGRFKWLAFGTTLSSLVAMARLRLSTSLTDIWSGGIVSLFLGRLITAVLAVLDMNGFIPRRKPVVIEEKAK